MKYNTKGIYSRNLSINLSINLYTCCISTEFHCRRCPRQLVS